MDREDQERFQLEAVYVIGPDLGVRCMRCHRWSTYINRPLSLADLNDRLEEHVAVCP